MRFQRDLALIPAFLFLAGFVPALWSGAVGSAVEPVEKTHLWVSMRDHVRLATDVYRPAGGGRLPTILVRTPYGKESKYSSGHRSYADRGYNVVVQDVRGRNDSEGVFSPLSQEGPDGDDTLNWIAAQTWSDGNVGMAGASYLGMVQWKVAVRNNAHLKAIAPAMASPDDYRDRMYSSGGAMKWGHRLEWVMENMREPGFVAPAFQQFIWTLPLRRADRVITGTTTALLQEAFDHPSYDAFWKAVNATERLEQCSVPVFSVAGWYDNYAEGELNSFSVMRKRSAMNRIVVGPWPHNMASPIRSVDFGPDAAVPVRRLQGEWFDQWLKGRALPAASRPPLRLFVMGANVWRDENEWPLARAVPTKFYLESEGHANTSDGDGVLSEAVPAGRPADEFVYDPKNPVRTMGGAVCCNEKVFPWGPIDQRPVEKRSDVLVYTSRPLREEVEVTGPISLVLYAATSATDTDFTGKLVDVYPDGRAINLTDGMLRARYRQGLEKPKPLKPGEPAKLTVDVGVTSNVFRKGHRIRLEVSSSNFPRFDRNPNTGRAVADEIRTERASQTIYHERKRRSYLNLPVIPARLGIPTGPRV